jgi:hypothetical protein
MEEPKKCGFEAVRFFPFITRFCCGREAVPKARRIRQRGIRRIDDPHHPGGYR